MRYILNSAVITAEGKYEYRLLDKKQAKEWLSVGPYENTIGYQETCDAFFLIFGKRIKINRKLIKMEKGDQALVFRLTCRLQDVGQKGKLSILFILENCEIGLIIKTE